MRMYACMELERGPLVVVLVAQTLYRNDLVYMYKYFCYAVVSKSGKDLQ